MNPSWALAHPQRKGRIVPPGVGYAPAVRLSGSFKAAAITAAITGVLALLAYNGVESDPECGGKWGYVVKDATTCGRDPYVFVSQVLGAICALCVIAMIRGLIVYRRQQKASGFASQP